MSEKTDSERKVEGPIGSVIKDLELRAQSFIEEEIEPWKGGAFHVTEVSYKRGPKESLLLFDFQPIRNLGIDHPSVRAIFRRSGTNKDGSLEIEEFYIFYDDMSGRISNIYERTENGVRTYLFDDDENEEEPDIVKRLKGLMSGLKDLNYKVKL